MEIRKPNIVAEFKRPARIEITPKKQRELNLKFYIQVIEAHQEEFDYYFRFMCPTQIRISNQEKTIDIYPKGQKFCKIPQNIWGTISDFPEFLKKEFS